MAKKGLQILVVCGTCGKIKDIPEWKYRHNKYKKFYCSNEHRIEGTKRQVIINCANCNDEMSVSQSRAAKSNKIYCSRRCQSEDMNTKIEIPCSNCKEPLFIEKFRREKSKNFFCDQQCHGEFNRKLEYRKCDYCGEEFSDRPSIINTGCKHKFCCREHYSLWISENRIGENNPLYKRVETFCSWCGEILFVVPSKLEMYDNQFCCDEHYSKWKSLTNTLRACSAFWDGKRKKGNYETKFNEETKELIRERDNNKCWICGGNNDGKTLHVHHKNYDKLDTTFILEINSVSGLKENNLISLCNSCHSKTNYNREFWENWFNSASSFYFASRSM